jgi:tRNA pseudouridine13 synthase
MEPSSVEKSIGLTTFYTDQPGVGGILRYTPEDFIVEELPEPFPDDPKGRFLLVNVTAKNWETNDLIREFANKLHISKKRISFAGTKDKRAVTSQIFCFFRVKADQVHQISIPDVTSNILHYTTKRVDIGNLKGNKFTTVIRNIEQSIKKEHAEKMLQQLQSLRGFPNFFGVQRFGGIRPITHKVGRAMVSADFKKAVMIYLTETSEFESEDAIVARNELARTEDFKKGFHQFPQRLRYEKILMQHLTNKPEDYVGALQKLPGNLLTMFVYAFQSYLFNRMLSQRIKQKIPLDKAINNDIILPVTHKGVSKKPIHVTENNLKKVNEQIEKGKAVISCIIPGSETTYKSGPMGKIQQSIIQEEKVDIRNFIIPEIPAASSYGTHRPILSPITSLSSFFETDEYHPGHYKLTLSFSLLKGSYATSFLREIMKIKDITKY